MIDPLPLAGSYVVKLLSAYNATPYIIVRTRPINHAFPQANPDTLKRYNCNNNKECLGLTGIMACRLGHCSNMSELYQCYYNKSGSSINSDTENLKLNGYFTCDNGR